MIDLNAMKTAMEAEMRLAQALIERGGSVMQHFIAFNDNGASFVLMTPWADDAQKIATLDFLKQFFLAHRVSLYLFVCEAWFAYQSTDELKRDGPISPTMRPDRQECIEVLGVMHDNHPMALTSTIERTAKGVTCKAAEWANGHQSGRMTELLPSPVLAELAPESKAEIDRMFAGLGGQRRAP